MRVLRTVLPALALVLPLAVASAQTTWYVDVQATPPGSGTHANPYASIQHAIDQPTTISGDTVLVLPGTYVENVDYNGKSIRLESTGGPAVTVIDGNEAGSCVTINGSPGTGALLEGFTLTHGLYFTGGGLYSSSSSPTIRDCVIRQNTATIRGGGIWVAYGSPVLERCVVSNNVVTGPNGTGGGMYSMYGFTMTVRHCTFTRNASASVAGYMSEFSTGATVENSIFWNNGGADLSTYQSNVAIRHCDVGGGFAGTGNFDADPLFWNPIGFDFHLKPGSPCIDAGDPASPLDPDGSTADVGAHPFDASYCGEIGRFCSAKLNSQGCTPSIGWSGNPSATSASPFLITASNVINNKTGILIYGYAPNATPWQGGLLCIGGPLKRTPAQNSGGNPPPDDCSGTLSFDFNARIQSGVDAGLVPAATVCAQYYYRDPPASFAVGLTDATAFTICP